MGAGACETAAVVLDDYLAGEADDARLAAAQEGLEKSLAGSDGDAWCRALAAYMASVRGDVAHAVTWMEQAHAADAADPGVALLRVALLIDAEMEDRALAGLEALANDSGVDLGALRAELEAIGFPADARTLLANGFPSARNSFLAAVRERAEQARSSADPGLRRRRLQQQENDCAEAVAELAATFASASIPESLQPLIPWAQRLGIGDDGCRERLFSRLSASESAQLRHLIDGTSAALHTWLDGYAGGAMPAEAAAFMYLALGVEERAWRAGSLRPAE